VFAPSTPVTLVAGVFLYAVDVTVGSVTLVGIDLGKHSSACMVRTARGCRYSAGSSTASSSSTSLWSSIPAQPWLRPARAH